MVFGFDIDGVLYPWHLFAWMWWRRRTSNSTLSFDEFWKWPNGWVAQNEGTDLVEEMVMDRNTYFSAKISPYVYGAVWEIADNFADEIYYITGRPAHVKDGTLSYLMKNNLPRPKNLFFADEYGGKLNIVKELKCDYYAEDRPKYLEVLPQVTKVFAVTTPYNTYREWDAIRVHHVMEIPQILEGIHGIQ